MQEIRDLVDQLGQLSDEEKTVKKKRDEIKKQLEELEISPGTYEGSDYTLTVSEGVRTVYDPKKISKRLSPAEFLQVVTVSAQAIGKHLLPKDLDRCVESQTSYNIFKTKKNS